MYAYLILGAIYSHKKEQLSQTETGNQVGMDGVEIGFESGKRDEGDKGEKEEDDRYRAAHVSYSV